MRATAPSGPANDQASSSPLFFLEIPTLTSFWSGPCSHRSICRRRPCRSRCGRRGRRPCSSTCRRGHCFQSYFRAAACHPCRLGEMRFLAASRSVEQLDAARQPSQERDESACRYDFIESFALDLHSSLLERLTYEEAAANARRTVRRPGVARLTGEASADMCERTRASAACRGSDFLAESIRQRRCGAVVVGRVGGVGGPFEPAGVAIGTSAVP